MAEAQIMETGGARVAKHSSATVEHFSPPDVVERARSTMGRIDLDPASCVRANAEVIRADAYFDTATDGLAQSWYGRVFLNPPGGSLNPTPDSRFVPAKHGRFSSAKLWRRKLVREYQSGRVQQAVFLGFNLEILQSSQSYTRDYPWPGVDIPIMRCTFCLPAARLAFLYIDGDDEGRLKVGGGPTHANVIAYLGPFHDRFLAAYRSLGCCAVGKTAARGTIAATRSA